MAQNPHPYPQQQHATPPPGHVQPNVPPNPNTVYQGDSTLPPPGHQREETLKQRADQLEQEKAKYEGMAYNIDPSKMNVDREIRYELEKGSLDIPNKDPNYVYTWVQCQYPMVNPTLKVEQKLARSVTIHKGSQSFKVPAWEIVTNRMPESKGLRINATGHCQIGDTILMRCHKDVHRLIELKDRERKLQLRRNTDAQLLEQAARVQRRGYKAAAGQDVYNKYRKDANDALDTIDTMLREGTLPGININQSK